MSNRLYTSIPAPKVPRNTFDRSRPNSFTMHFQRCYPTMLEEILPGDLFNVGLEAFARLQPLQAPVMNNMKLSNHFFFVPLRTINKHFAEFMFNNRSGDYSEVLPYTHTLTLMQMISDLNIAESYDLAAECIRLFDFIGLPFRYSSNTVAEDFVDAFLQDAYNLKVATSNKRVNVLPFVAYQKIWSEYFRDENVEEDPFVLLEDNGYSWSEWTGDLDTMYQTADDLKFLASVLFRLRPRAWAHDRFTSSLPFAQRGPDVLLPIAGSAPVEYKDGYLAEQRQSYAQIVVGVPDQSGIVEAKGGFITGNAPSGLSGSNYILRSGGTQASLPSAYDPNGSLIANFDDAALTTTINSFRRAERLQRWYENSARGGVRPNEATLAHFGVHTPDASLDRAEFLGGTMQPIVISEVAQTSETTEGSPQGTLAGKGTSYKGANGFRAYFTEHGYVFCFTSALVRANYWQGLPKVFSRMQRDEYYWPEFANLGEEPVYTKELYLDDSVKEDDVFGYVPRYSDYKSAVGEVHGDMRSSLSFWTQTREFDNVPALNRQFLFGNPSLSPFAVQSQTSDPIISTIQFRVKASRLMPFYGVPTI